MDIMLDIKSNQSQFRQKKEWRTKHKSAAATKTNFEIIRCNNLNLKCVLDYFKLYYYYYFIVKHKMQSVSLTVTPDYSSLTVGSGKCNK